ncbi:aspartate aminotransferase family protein [Paraburkholderia silviterrae]|uniref:Aminotransferase class III-fold pyridoxal phosphate-dependent enzyme n=1 Tax=Paraburkholderia silviterrae TaxID=2528715 RepID=A0A4R5LZF2_9BURK|nr:aminotransferase class III-fold pyridoxal phosphate-dependent enzyme [Paraburkholderia silviterrae]TDG17956.1 aminotransferase class III-fold pyridoxal phosphate-dependent enzyme [Paraburkholderia silviterrae]
MIEHEMNTDAENDIRMADVRNHFHPVTNPQTLERLGPAIVSEGEGIRVRIDGKTYIDGFSGLGCVNVGYGNQTLCDAAYAAMKRLSFCHSFLSQSNEHAALLSAKLAELTNGEFEKFFFASTGSDANESVVKLAWYYWRLRGQPKRKILLSREYAYHGNTVVATALTGIGHYHHQFDLPLKGLVHHVNASYGYRCGEGLTPLEQGRAAAASLENKIVELGAENIAAFFVEPIQGAGGIIMPSEGYLQAVQEICNRYDILLVADEVVTGFGKTGAMFAWQHYGFKPDILSLAKGITSSYFPLSAVGLSKRVAAVFAGADEDFEHGFTNSGHPVAAAVALANIDVIEREKLLENVTATIGPTLRKWMERFAKHPSVGEARSVGVIAALDFCWGDSEAEQAAFCERVGHEAFNNGLITRPIGPVLGLMFPLITNAAELESSMTMLERAIETVFSELRTEMPT